MSLSRPASAGACRPAFVRSSSSPALKTAALASLDLPVSRKGTFGVAALGNDLLAKMGSEDGKSTVLCVVCWRGGMKKCRLHWDGALSGYLTPNIRDWFPHELFRNEQLAPTTPPRSPSRILEMKSP